MTFAVLRSLHEIIGHAIDEIERVYVAHADDPRSTPSSKRSSPIPTKAGNQPSTPSAPDGGGSTRRTAMSEVQAPPNLPMGMSSAPNSGAYASPPPSPLVATPPSSHTEPPSESQLHTRCIDFPSLDVPHDGTSMSEILTTHPSVLGAIQQIVAATGQLEAMVQTPFLTLCGAIMSYHLPSCMRLLEAAHVVEILREAGPSGLSVELISQKNGVSPSKLAHIMRLLATHHFLREIAPDVFTLNRLSSLVDSGKTFEQIKTFENEGRPEMKYTDTNGVAAFVGLCTDEIQKSSGYLTETYYLSPSSYTRSGADPVRAPFCIAFDTVQSETGFFGWLEGEGLRNSDGEAACDRQHQYAPPPPPPPHLLAPARGLPHAYTRHNSDVQRPSGVRHASDRAISGRAEQGAAGDRQGQARKKRTGSPVSPGPATADTRGVHNPNRFRLERFGKAMSGTDGWEVPGAVLNGFDWASLPWGSIVVDVGGGIGSTSMILATAFSQEGAEDGGRGLKFVIQDRAVVCEMGEKAWKAKCPELLEESVKFQVHDFFTPQPVKNASVFLLRVVLHDWPDDFARKILLQLRKAASPVTKLLIADFVLPLACPDDTSNTGVLEGVEGAESVLAPAPLLPNLGKASANVYWMDLTMQVMFNSQERTLREMVSLTLSAGWKIIKVTKTPGSLFGYLVAIPVAIPEPVPMITDEPLHNTSGPVQEPGREISPTGGRIPIVHQVHELDDEYSNLIKRTTSRCGTPTFGSNMRLSSASETLSRFGGGNMRSKTIGRSFSTPSVAPRSPPGLKPALSLSSSAIAVKKKKPSPLSVQAANMHIHGSPTPAQSPRRTPSALSSPQTEGIRSPQTPAPAPRTIARRMSLATLRSPHATYATFGPPPPLPVPLTGARAPLSPKRTRASLTRRASQANLTQPVLGERGGCSPIPPLPSLIPVRISSSVGAGMATGLSSPSGGTHSQCLGTAGLPIQLTRLTRRASSAQLPRSMLRKRAGTVGVDGFEGRGTVLSFDAVPDFPVEKAATGEAYVSGSSTLPALEAAACISSGTGARLENVGKRLP